MEEDSGHRRIVYPFTAIVGMEKAKKALLAVAVNPLIGGVLLRGDKGTGKTTLVRGLANVLPEIPVVKGCPFNCNPFNPLEMCDNCYDKWRKGEELQVEYKKMKVVDLPLSITPDRLIGTVDFEKALREGKRVLKPGILAEANRNILYIDEVNLLDDYIADLILDAAAYGWNIIEREHVSFRHPARFILIGSMNPEEGELRPQILDRFGLVVDVEAPMDPEHRAEIVRRVEEFSNDPLGFYRRYEVLERELTEKIRRARKLVTKTTVDDGLLKLLTKTLVELKVRTCRAEITIIRTAKALAALDGRTRVDLKDLEDALELALPHRLDLRPIATDKQLDMGKVKERLEKHASGNDENREAEHNDRHHIREESNNDSIGEGNGMRPGDSSTTMSPDKDFALDLDYDHRKSIREKPLSINGSRRVCKTVLNKPYGVPISYVTGVKHPVDVDIIGTMVNLFANNIVANSIPKDLLEDLLAVKMRRVRTPSLTVIVLDTSGSMNVSKRIAYAKKIALELVEKSYSSRDKIALITFRRNGVDIYIPPTRKYSKIVTTLEKTPSGGRTPLSAALKKAYETAKAFKAKHRDAYIRLILISDGKANKPLNNNIGWEINYYSRLLGKLGVEATIIDTRGETIDPSRNYLDIIASLTKAHITKI